MLSPSWRLKKRELKATRSPSTGPTFGAIFNRQRQRLRLSLRDVAAEVRGADGRPVSRQYLNAIEKGRKVPSVNVILELCRVLGIEPQGLPWTPQHCHDLLAAHLSAQPDQAHAMGDWLYRMRERQLPSRPRLAAKDRSPRSA